MTRRITSSSRSASFAMRATRTAWVLLLALAAVAISGCFDAPEIEDRWTRVDLKSASLTPGQVMPAGTQTITMHATVTYRAVLTGFAVAELRVADSLGTVDIRPDAPRVPMAEGIDAVLAGSRSLGRATRAVTGWDHLIQPLELTFDAAAADSAGSRLFLLCYLGSGERMELASGADSIVITPFISSERQVLPIGMELGSAPGGAPGSAIWTVRRSGLRTVRGSGR